MEASPTDVTRTMSHAHDTDPRPAARLCPFPYDPTPLPWHERDVWPARWVTVANEPAGSFASAFRLKFACKEQTTVTLLVTADQRYHLHLDGRRIGMGPQRGALRKWYYERYPVTLAPGEHTIAAITWFQAVNPPAAQVTVRPGFLLAVPEPEHTEQLSTGLAPWQGRVLENIAFLDSSRQVGRSLLTGHRVAITGTPPEDLLTDDSGAWAAVEAFEPGNNAFLRRVEPDSRVLFPAALPAMRSQPFDGGRVRAVRPQTDPAVAFTEKDTGSPEKAAWQDMLNGAAAVTVAAGQCRQILIDLNDYVCAYYRLGVSGGDGSEIRVSWAERLSTSPERPVAPDERNRITDRYFVGTWDEYRSNGHEAAVHGPLWWQAGRYVMLTVTAGGTPVTITALTLLETGFPLMPDYRFSCDDGILNAVAPVCYRTLECCAHETYMDCPYWEQLQYIGDGRVQALLTYATSRNSLLAEKMLGIYRHSLTGSEPFLSPSFPCRVGSAIAPFSLWWICMLHDHARWRGNRELVKDLLPLAWWIAANFLAFRDGHGLIRSPRGWNFVDAVFYNPDAPGTRWGGVFGPINWQMVLALDALKGLAAWTGEPEQSARADRLAAELADACTGAFWNDRRRALADNLQHTQFSEHSQILALLTGRLPKPVEDRTARALLEDQSLIRVLPYFGHYLCDALARLGRGDVLVERLHGWKAFLDAGLKTFPEHGILERSDCHAWSAHPLYHMLHTLLGIRPGSFGFETVEVRPCPGPLRKLDGAVPHPKGEVSVALEVSGKHLVADITLPEGVAGTLVWNGIEHPLNAGSQQLHIP